MFWAYDLPPFFKFRMAPCRRREQRQGKGNKQISIFIIGRAKDRRNVPGDRNHLRKKRMHRAPLTKGNPLCERCTMHKKRRTDFLDVGNIDGEVPAD